MAADPPFIQRTKTDNPLHDLLLECCVPEESGKKSITVLARQELLSTESVHKWCRKLAIPPMRAKAIVDRYAAYRARIVANAEIMGDEVDLRDVTLEDFYPYIFSDSAK